jgi:hypothetical protein
MRNRIRKFGVLPALSAAAILISGACSNSSLPRPPFEESARVTAELAQAPSDVRCLQIEVSGSRVVRPQFDVTPGQATSFALTDLPVGEVVFVANAFASVCSAVLSTSVPDYDSDPVSAILRPGANAGVTLLMHTQAAAPVSVQFPGSDDETCNAGGGLCTQAEQCCSHRCDFQQGPVAGTGVCGDTSVLEGPLATLPESLKRSDFRLRPPVVQAVLAGPRADGTTSLQVDFAPDTRLSAGRQLVLGTDEAPIVLTPTGAPNGRTVSFTGSVPIPFKDVLDSQTRLRAVATAKNFTRIPVFRGREVVAAASIPQVSATSPFPVVMHLLELSKATRTLFMTDDPIVKDPARTVDCTGTGTPMGAWTFGRLMTDMAGAMDPSDFVNDWLQTLASDQSYNGITVPAAGDLRNGWPRKPNGKLDLAKAPLQLVAIVNRIDLAGNTAFGQVSGAEGRFIFQFVSGSCQPLPTMVILEYGVNISTCSGLRSWAQQWEQLASIADPASYNAALQVLTDQFAGPNANINKPNGSALDQLRVDTEIGSNQWQLREYHLDVGAPPAFRLRVRGIAQTPDVAYNGGVSDLFPAMGARAPQLAQWLLGEGPNATVPLSLPFSPGGPFRGAFVLNDNLDFWSAPGAVPNSSLHVFSLNTCDGCHGRETGTAFRHIALPDDQGMSGFLTGAGGPVTDPRDGTTQYTYGDLLNRAQRLQDIANSFCGSMASAAPPGLEDIVFPSPVPALAFQPLLSAD